MDEKILNKIYNSNTIDFKKYIKTLDFSLLLNIKNYLDDIYYNSGESNLEDYKYDILEKYIKSFKEYKTVVGAKLREGENKVNLPYWLGSLDKITPKETQVFNRWIEKNYALQYIIGEKLDGVSCLLEYKNNNIYLYTRGNGITGSDISYLGKYIQNIPEININLTIRGELIIKKSIFENKYRNQIINGRQYKNSRNMVSGLIGSKTIREGLNDINFIAYEIIDDNLTKIPSEQLKILKNLKFKTMYFEILNKLNLDILEKKLLEFKNNSEFEIDGLVVQSDTLYDRNIDGNPDYMFAFKMLFADAIHKTKVKYIEWNISKWGHLKPVAIVDPVQLNDITISRVTAHNAKYIEDNNLGPNSIIEITRSKDVIPYIVSVLESSIPDMPEMEYIWDKNHVNIFIKDIDNNTICIKIIVNFFSQLGVKFISNATVTKMYNAGFTNLFKILEAEERDFLSLSEFQEKSAKRVYENIHKGLKNVKISSLIAASSVLGYGIGFKKIQTLLESIPELLTIYKNKSKDELIDMIVNVEGFSYITAEKIAENIKYAEKFINKIKKYITIEESKKVSNSLDGNKFVMSGFRDKELENNIIDRGGKVLSSISGNTTALIVKNKNNEKNTSKYEKAEKLKLPIYEKEEFIKKYIN